MIQASESALFTFYCSSIKGQAADYGVTGLINLHSTVVLLKD